MVVACPDTFNQFITCCGPDWKSSRSPRLCSLYASFTLGAMVKRGGPVTSVSACRGFASEGCRQGGLLGCDGASLAHPVAGLVPSTEHRLGGWRSSGMVRPYGGSHINLCNWKNVVLRASRAKNGRFGGAAGRGRRGAAGRVANGGFKKGVVVG